jgi:hypothetical protein
MGNNLLLLGALAIGIFMFKDQIAKAFGDLSRPKGSIDPAISPVTPTIGTIKGINPLTGKGANLAQSWYYPKDDLRLTVG